MKRRPLFFVKLAVSIGLLGVLVTLVDLRTLLDRFRDVDLRFIAVAVGIFFAQYVLSTFKWQVLLRADGIVMPYGFLLRTYMIGNFMSLFLPTSFGGDVYRVLATKGVNRDLAKSTSSVLFDRLSGLFALVSIACVSYVFLPEGRYKAPLVGLYLVGIACFLAFTSDRAVERLRASRFAVLSKTSKLLRSIHRYTRTRWVLFVVLGVSFLFQLNIVFMNKAYTLALGMDVLLGQLLVIIPLIYLTEALPIAINGLGVRESAFVFFFVLIGRSKEEGLALSLLVIGMRYLLAMTGGLVLLGTILDVFKRPANSTPRHS
jgi:uncharacterized protein (TIRG00374 family)